MTDEELYVLQEELNEIKSTLHSLRADANLKSKLAEDANQKYFNASTRARKLEYEIAQFDGRMKKVKTGRSGIKKKVDTKDKSFDLAAFTNSLSQEAREAFIRKLLNPNT